MQRRRSGTREGFTLAELLIAMTIVMILAAIALLGISSPREQSYRSTMKSDIRTLATAQELYHQANLEYGELADLSEYETTTGVTVAINHADGAGYAAVATHAGLPNVECGLFVGTVPGGTAGPATEPGQIVCD